MRWFYTIPLIIVMASMGCAHSDSATGGSTVTQVTSAINASAFVGTWLYQVVSVKDPIRVKLSKSGHWEWRPPIEMAGLSKQPTQAGRWSIAGDQLVLTVEQTESDKIMPGHKFSFTVLSVAPGLISIRDFNDETTTWRRAP